MVTWSPGPWCVRQAVQKENLRGAYRGQCLPTAATGRGCVFRRYDRLEANSGNELLAQTRPIGERLDSDAVRSVGRRAIKL